ncbi:MAG: electron transfer flavoprotein-ubiquinone oxidoreductase [Hyphomicrobium sp.]|jgi:electron-transferring-flavoprotein dehydrogenase|uniref:electron transfer flavoprotein-ubiquinone oxidoreductase n=1 Tax=Hyphomicrobium sp. TaxID=82 RepID=UPI0025C57B47|nr:electron transfer flavoprotein-ubiquinone oxidoreductase [Hyphomicrobium sp.]MBX9864774.1 electron transfer flavoprotein-ubiquinone oxidoreductase [Hyphomicrobium sp.]
MASEESDLPEREAMEFDVVIVGAGPAGLSAAIRIKQLAVETGQDISVVVLEKGSEVGAHILSGAVIDPVGLNALIPDWRERGAPLTTQVTEDRFLVLGPAGDVQLPNMLMPPLMNNHGNYIGSLGLVVRWLGEQAAELGVEVYPGFAATEVLYDAEGAVVGVATGDMGVARDGTPKDTFQRGMELRGKYTLIAEGARGSLAKTLISRFDLARNAEPQKYGIGLKELWEVSPELHRPGLVQHSFGWPLDLKTGGGSFLYHYGKNLVSVGFVLHLNYDNPYLSPYDEFQRFKTHPAIRSVFAGGRRIAYGARALTEGGWQSIPKLAFPGGALLGCSAGFMNLPRIKGSHNAVLSGIHAAEAAVEALAAGRAYDVLEGYETAVRAGPIATDLKRVRNVKPLWSRFGTVAGVGLGGIDMWLRTILFGWSPLGTLGHGKSDAKSLRKARNATPIAYAKPDGVLTFDKLTNVSFSATNHEEDQPVHLKLTDPAIPIEVNLPQYAEPAQRYCPAGVYEVVRDEAGGARFQINAQNCVHCKTCDIKDPSENITWVCPEGGGGPNYAEM